MSVDECFGTETLVDLVEGRSDAALRARIEGHASRCEPCRRLLSSLARGSEATDVDASGPVAEVPPRLGRYVVERALGAGGMGIVYAARDPELQRTVAVKLLRSTGDARMQERLRREAQALAQLAHPNVVAVHDVGVHDGRIFIAMEHVEGETLAAWTVGSPPGTPRAARDILDAYVAAGRGLAAAHAVGIVHRDFKPENVLVGGDGRVRVADFGLARTEGTPGAVSSSDAAHVVSPDAPTTPALGGGGLTASGAVAGTPYYMAPELYRGGDADPRSDQFSFCVALFTALYGERPFRGASFDELRDAVTAGQLHEPSSASRRGVPARAATAIRRGLAVEPAARFASMDALLAELAPARPRRWPWIVAPIAAAGALLAGGALLVARRDEPAPCGGAGEALRGVWDPQRRAAVAAALRGTGMPYAEASRGEVERLLDRYAADWQTMHAEACAATRVRKEQTEDVLDLRMTCLDDRRHALDGAVATLATSDRTIAEHAVSVAAALPALQPCSDVSGLRTLVRPPNPAMQVQVTQLRAQLAKLRAQASAGIYPPTLSAARTVLDQAVALGYRPLEAEAQTLVGLLERDTESYAASRASYERAVLAAEAGRDDPTLAFALVELVVVVGRGLSKHDEVEPLRARAKAVLERLDHPPALEAELLQAVGMVEVDAGQLAEAERDLFAALALVERVHGPDDMHVVEPLHSLASIELARERPAQAMVHIDRMLAIESRVLGAEHPAVARALSIKGGAAFGAGAYDDAIALQLRAQHILERTHGPDSLAVANVLSNLASAYESRGDGPTASLPLHRRAVAIAETKLGATHPVTLSYRTGQAAALEEAGRTDEALAVLESVLAAQETARGDHPDTATTLEALAYVEAAARRYAAARDHALKARAMFERVLGDTYNPHVELSILGDALFGLGDANAACDAFEASRRAGAELDDQGAAAWLDARLGRALVEAHRDPGRGRSLVLAAYPRVASDPRLAEQLAELVAWMKQRRIPVPPAT